MMAMEVHGMHFAAVVLDVHQHHVTLAYHIHRDIWIKVAVDRPPHARSAFHKAGSAINQIVEPAAGLSWIKAQRGRRAVRQQVQLGVGVRWRRNVGALRSDDHRGRLGQLNPECVAVAGHLHFEINTGACGERHRAAGHLGRSMYFSTVYGQQPVGAAGPHLHWPVIGVGDPDPDPLAGLRWHAKIFWLAIDGPKTPISVRTAETSTCWAMPD